MPAYATAVLDALADPTRRSVLELVARRPRSVTEIADVLPVSRPAVSQHLRVLRRAHLVTDTAVGTRRIYRLDTRGLVDLRAYVEELEQLWRTALASFAAYAEHEYGTANRTGVRPPTASGGSDDPARH